MKRKHTLPTEPVEKIIGIGGPKVGSFVVVVRLTDGKEFKVTIAPGSPLEIVENTTERK